MMNDITRQVMAAIAAKEGFARPGPDDPDTPESAGAPSRAKLASGEAMDERAKDLHDALKGDYAKRGGGRPACGPACLQPGQNDKPVNHGGRAVSLDDLAGLKR